MDDLTKTKFKQAVRRLNPMRSTVAAEDYVLRGSHRGAGELHLIFDLDPLSRVAVTGPIGIGKSSEMHYAQGELDRSEDEENSGLVFYVDVGAALPLEQVNAGTVLALLLEVSSLGVRSLIEKHALDDDEGEFGSLRSEIRGVVEGEYRKYDLSQVMNQRFTEEFRPGFGGKKKTAVLSDERDRVVRKYLRLVKEICAKVGRVPALFMDGLDRLPHHFNHTSLLVPILSLLSEEGFGYAVVLGADTARHGSELAEYFDQAVQLRPIDVADRPAFVANLLRARDARDLFDDTSVQRLADYGAGVPRDTVQLARECLQIAYRNHQPRVVEEHVEAAADALAVNMLTQLSADQMQVLMKSPQEVNLDTRPDWRFELVRTKVVLERRIANGTIVLETHPAIARRIEKVTQAELFHGL